MKAKLPLAAALVLGVSHPHFGQAQDWPLPKGSCATPVKYRIGKLDPRFGITRQDFQRQVEEAGKAWETAAGQTLFEYDARGALEVDLVYDGRQEMTQRLSVARAGIREKLKQADLIKDTLLPLQNRFDALDESYSAQLNAFKQQQDKYNAAVGQSNASGGAVEAEIQRFNHEREGLKKQADVLEERKKELNRLTEDINALVDRHNTLLRRANAEANALSTSGAFGLEFEEGRYIRQAGEQRIQIYQYEGEEALRIILAHELGHALGIRHNANPSSVMSPLIHTDRLTLTADDLDGLAAECMRR